MVPTELVHGGGLSFSINSAEQLEFRGDRYSLDLHAGRNQLLRCYDASGKELFVLNAGEIWVEWKGTTYNADVAAFPPEMHLLNAGRHFVEAHVQNIVLTSSSGNWPGLVELSIYAHNDALYIAVDFIANDSDWIMKRNESHDTVVYVYESREGFRDWPGGAPASRGFDLTFSEDLKVDGDGVRLSGAPITALPTVPAGSAEFAMVANNKCRVSVSVVDEDWTPGSVHSSGAVLLFANDQARLKQRVYQELNPLSEGHFEMTLGDSRGFDKRTGVYAINGSLPTSSTPPPGHMRGSIFSLSNDEAPRTLLVSQICNWGGISGGIIRDKDLFPLPIDIQFGLNYPEFAAHGETGYARLFFPLQMEAGEQTDLRGTTLYSSRTDRSNTFLNLLESAGHSPGIVHVALDRHETHTTRLGGEFRVTDFRPHPNDRRGPSASASLIRFLTLSGVAGADQLKGRSTRILEAGPDLYEYEVEVSTDDGSISGSVRLWGGAVSDMNRFFSEVNLEFHAPVTVSQTGEVPISFLSYQVGNPMVFRKYAYRGEDGDTVIGGLTNAGSGTVHVDGAPMSTPFFAMMYEAHNTGGEGITISDRSGNPVMMVYEWDVRFGNLQIEPGIRAFASGVANNYHRGIAVVPSENTPFSGTIPAGSRIYYKALHLTGGMTEADHTLGEREFEAWSNGLTVTTAKGWFISSYPIHMRAETDGEDAIATFAIEGGKNWIPVRVSGLGCARGIEVRILDSEGERSPVTVIEAEPWYTVSRKIDGTYQYTFLVERRLEGPISIEVNGTREHAAIGTPMLRIQRWLAGQARLSWPAAADGWALQRSSAPGGGYAWIGREERLEADERAVYEPISAEAQFYRLIR